MSNASQNKEDIIMQTPLKPPFTRETALLKVKAAEDAWNSRDPERVALAYTPDSQWRNRTEFFTGREAIKAFLRRKWAKELDYRLMKELWCTPTTASRCVSSTNGVTRTRDSGCGRMGMNIGNLMKRDSCSGAI